MKRLASLLTLALAAAVATPAYSQSKPNAPTFASDYQTVAVMVNGAGLAGATFQTWVALMNPTSSSYTIAVALYDAAGIKRDATITLAAGELKTYPNFLDSVFHFSGAGAATFRASGTDNRFILNTEVRTVAGGTRYGTTVPALEFAGSSSPSFAAGVTADADSRTNVGCFNQSSSTNLVEAQVYDATGHHVTTVEISLPAHAWGQRGVAATVNGGYVRFAPSDAAVCYAVVVNNSTNDARFITAEEYTP